MIGQGNSGFALRKAVKRVMDIVVSLLGLLVLFPCGIAVAVWIKLDSPGPVFFRQVRVGRFGAQFRIHKFRTMCMDSERAGQLTIGADQRITRSGRFLRATKMDELPQLIDVLTGAMSLVGPRPEVPKYVACYSEQDRHLVLSVRPGITDLASIEFKDENRILGESNDPERDYIEKILPIKLAYYRDYAANFNPANDIWIICKTILAIVR